MVARVVIITRAWPYPPGEQFVGDEAPFWVRDDLDVVVMPWWAKGQPVSPPSGVKVDLTLARRTRADDLRAAVVALREPTVRAELVGLLRSGGLDRPRLANLVRTARGALVAREQLRAWIRRNGPIDVLYSWWFDSWTLGALMLKGQGIAHVATRVHGYDLYEERNPVGHHALRRALVGRLDALLPVARSGGEYAVRTFGVDPAVVHHAPLGVAVPEQLAATSPAGELHLLSVASCLPVKRIDRLVDACGLLAAAHPELQLHWTHLGGGALHGELAARAAALTAPNLHVEMPGQVTNDQVRRFLAEQPVDLFVNSSESEGVPVSVMEAMAFGVPAVAPAVGALDEIVPADGSAGLLLSSSPDAEELAAALWQLHEQAKLPAMRTAARRVVVEGYDRSVNHARLAGLLSGLSKS